VNERWRFQWGKKDGRLWTTDVRCCHFQFFIFLISSMFRVFVATKKSKIRIWLRICRNYTADGFQRLSNENAKTLQRRATKQHSLASIMTLVGGTSLLDVDEPARTFLERTQMLPVLAALFERGVQARTLLTRIGVSRAVAISTEQALDVWFSEQQPSLGELVTVLAAMFERDAARELGLTELYDEIVIESESYDGDPAPLARTPAIHATATRLYSPPPSPTREKTAC
jgi:hypothetical protein